MNIYQTIKSNCNENILFWRKIDETIWKPPLSKRTPPPFQLTPLFLRRIFMTPLFGQFSKTRTPPPSPPHPLILGEGGGNCEMERKIFCMLCSATYQTRQKFIFDSFKSVGHLLNDFKVIENYIHPNYLLFVLITLNRY